MPVISWAPLGSEAAGPPRLPFPPRTHQASGRGVEGRLIVDPYSWSHPCPLSRSGPEAELANQLHGAEQTKTPAFAPQLAGLRL